jgi:small-conductance mechanosensitive channel
MIFTLPAEPWVSWLISAGIFLASLGVALASRFLLGMALKIAAHRTRTELDDLIIRALVPPVFLGLLGLGLWLALSRLSELDKYADIINNSFIVIAILLGTVVAARVIDALLTWYGLEVAHRTSTDVDNRMLPIIRRVSSIVIYGVALMLVLDKLSVNITPLVAGLGIGGLAVAIALQSTLSNFLAGTYVVSDAVIRKGHYIMLDSGQEGLVEDIGWRSTKIRHWQGNLIVLPNSRLADAVVTDYEAIDIAKAFNIVCGVGYGSDLEKVEKVVLEVARSTQQHFKEGAKDFEPSVRFKEFGESNVNFAVVLKAVDRSSQYLLKHEFIKALHRRFKEENIIIEYPVRRIYMTGAEGNK